jgi:hypothetical protein
VKKLAYLRKERRKYEADYTIDKIWSAIPKVLANLGWTIEEIDDQKHHAKAKTKASFMSYSSLLSIDVTAVDKKTARVTVNAETPVTTITSISDFGRTHHRIETFFETLAKRLSK